MNSGEYKQVDVMPSEEDTGLSSVSFAKRRRVMLKILPSVEEALEMPVNSPIFGVVEHRVATLKSFQEQLQGFARTQNPLRQSSIWTNMALLSQTY